MTLCIATKRRRAGFTLVELLVVVGIIAVLLAIVLPAINRAYNRATRTRMAADIQTLTSALEAYRNDMRMYPRLDYSDGTIMGQPHPGAVLLCWALNGPGQAAQDGVDGPGFTLRPNGQQYGPYVEVGRFKIIGDNGAGANLTSGEPNVIFADRYGHPILYFAKYGNAPDVSYVADSAFTSAPSCVYNHLDNDTKGSAVTPELTLHDMQVFLGDNGASITNPTPDGKIGAGETAVYMGNYILWCAGPDEQFGYNTYKVSDDVTSVTP